MQRARVPAKVEISGTANTNGAHHCAAPEVKLSRMKTLAFPRAIVTSAALLISGLSHAQPNAPRLTPPRPLETRPAPGQIVTPDSLAGAIQDAERAQDSDTLLQNYGQAVTTPELARAAIGQLLSDYYKLRNQAKTADQATQAVSEALLRFMVLQTAQNQILVQQNQQMLQQNERIIELLEKQTSANDDAPVRDR